MMHKTCCCLLSSITSTDSVRTGVCDTPFYKWHEEHKCYMNEEPTRKILTNY